MARKLPEIWQAYANCKRLTEIEIVTMFEHLISIVNLLEEMKEPAYTLVLRDLRERREIFQRLYHHTKEYWAEIDMVEKMKEIEF